MTKPHLEVVNSDQPGLHGKCSHCDAYFAVAGPGLATKPEGAMEVLQAAFDKHFQKKHGPQETS
jgi:hypothetical protein